MPLSRWFDRPLNSSIGPSLGRWTEELRFIYPIVLSFTRSLIHALFSASINRSRCVPVNCLDKYLNLKRNTVTYK